VIPQIDKFDAITRPTIGYISGQSYIFYCRRSSIEFRDGAGSYSMFYRQIDLTTLKIKNEQKVIFPEADSIDWCSNMQCYPCIQTVGNKTYLFFNGNSFGENSLGYCEVLMKQETI
jgi:hypothetical protein